MNKRILFISLMLMATAFSQKGVRVNNTSNVLIDPTVEQFIAANGLLSADVPVVPANGTLAELQSTIPVASSLNLTTDTGQLFYGDGVTAGGVLIGATLRSGTYGGELSFSGTVAFAGIRPLGSPVGTIQIGEYDTLNQSELDFILTTGHTGLGYSSTVIASKGIAISGTASSDYADNPDQAFEVRTGRAYFGTNAYIDADTGGAYFSGAALGSAAFTSGTAYTAAGVGVTAASGTVNGITLTKSGTTVTLGGALTGGTATTITGTIAATQVTGTADTISGTATLSNKTIAGAIYTGNSIFNSGTLTYNNITISGTTNGVITRTGTYINGTYLTPTIQSPAWSGTGSGLLTNSGTVLVSGSNSAFRGGNTVYLDSDFNVTNTATVATVTMGSSANHPRRLPNFEMPIASGSTVTIHYTLYMTGTAGIKFSTTVSGGGSAYWMGTAMQTASANNTTQRFFAGPATGTYSFTYAELSNNTPQMLMCDMVVIGGTANGTAALQFAQQTAVSGTSTIKAGSSMRLDY